MILPDQNLSKSLIRQQIRLTISSISPSKRSAQEHSLSVVLNQWVDSISLTRGDLIFAFWPTLQEEPDFRDWLSCLQSQGIQYALPRLDWPTRTLRFLKIQNSDTDLEIAPNGLAQPRKSLEVANPDQVSAVLVPDWLSTYPVDDLAEEQAFTTEPCPRFALKSPAGVSVSTNS